MPTVYNVSSAAAVVGVSPSTLRNWIRQYAAHLSPGATPAPGSERILNDSDVAKLQFVKTQHDQLRDYDTINAELAQAPTDLATTPYIDVQATAKPTEALQPAPVATVGADVLQALQLIADERYDDLVRRVADMETKQKDRFTWFVFGLLCGVVIVAVVAAIVLAGASLR